MSGSFDHLSFDGSAGGFDVDAIFGRSGLGGDDVPRPYRKSPHRGWDKAEWKRRVKDNEEAVEDTLRETYAKLTGEEAPISVLARVDAIVRPVAKRQREAEPLRINWAGIANDYRRTVALMRLRYEEEALLAQIEEEDELLMMGAFT